MSDTRDNRPTGLVHKKMFEQVRAERDEAIKALGEEARARGLAEAEIDRLRDLLRDKDAELMTARHRADEKVALCREIAFWTVGESNRLSHETMEEAVEAFVEAIGGWPSLDVETWPDALPHQLEVCGYVRMRPELREGATLECTLGYLDEEYGDDDGFCWTKPTLKMQLAESAYHEAVLAEYKSWMHEPAVRRIVYLRAWRDALAATE